MFHLVLMPVLLTMGLLPPIARPMSPALQAPRGEEPSSDPLVRSVLPAFLQRNPDIRIATVVDVRVVHGDAVVVAAASTGKPFRGRLDDELWGVFLADARLTSVTRVLDVFATPRYDDYETTIDAVTQYEVTIVGRGQSYGDAVLRRTYPIDPSRDVAEAMSAATRMRRLRPAELPGLPPQVRDRLIAEQCLIPQASSRTVPHNALSGHFADARQTDWAVLCSHDGDLAVRVFWGGLASCPETQPLGREWLRLRDSPRWTYVLEKTSPAKAAAAMRELGVKFALPAHEALDGRYCIEGQWLPLEPTP